MVHLKLLTPLALLAGLFASLAAPAPALAQQAYAYNNIFDDNSGLTLAGLWAVDATPGIGANSAPGASAGNSLNWNNGVDFSGAVISGAARTGTIDLTNATAAQTTLTFYCWYNTETGPTYDQKWLRIFNATSGAQVYQLQIYNQGPAPGNCASLSAWHQHTLNPMPAGTTGIPIQVEFWFNAVDQGGNNGQGWFVDDLVIIGPDTTPPVAIADLALSTPTTSGMTVDWTSPFDDDTSGVAASFDLRYATAPITAATFSTATQVTGEPNPQDPGTAHTMNITGLNPGTAYYFAIRTTDQAGNTSLISNVPTLATNALPQTGGSATVAAAPPKDRYAGCSAGTEGAPVGLMALAAMIGLAAAVRTFLRK